MTELGDKIEECFAVRDEEDGDKEAEGSDNAEKRTEMPPPRTTTKKATARRGKRKSSSSADEVFNYLLVLVTRYFLLYTSAVGPAFFKASTQ